ncbi:2-phospho-L-lactate guanylyltransferase [Variovorax sp. V118]|uniref:2-phospho-L-lactate guanylyltransferase n=1 Tax=Variovorax sp. V118 TaxID=3065954 RepID=UPI0034E86F7A
MYVVVPIKRYALAKRRLAHSLKPEERREVSRMMAEWTLRTLAQSEIVSGVTVVTSEDRLLPLASQLSFDIVAEGENARGLNEAIDRGVRRALERGARDCCVLHADIPLLTAQELDQLFQRHLAKADSAVTIVTDLAGEGTNIRICRPPGAIGSLYGVCSARSHAEAARDAGCSVELLRSPMLSLDLDRRDDIDRVLAGARLGTLTSLSPAIRLLREWSASSTSLGEVHEQVR